MQEFERRLVFFSKENGITKPIILQPRDEELLKIREGVKEYFNRVLK